MKKQPIHLETRDTDGEGTARRYSSSAGRNSDVIAEVLQKHLPRGARVLEIASGTGEHAVHVCRMRDDVIWQTSDPDTDSRASQNDWACDRPGQILPSLDIDTTTSKWWEGLGLFDSLYCANMIHISPWEAALGLAQGAKHLLPASGKIFLYGPFKEGTETAPSNLRFDENLKERNPQWGVRDFDSVKHIFADVGFNHCARIVMPKENRLLIFTR